MKTCYRCRQQIPQLADRCAHCTTTVNYVGMPTDTDPRTQVTRSTKTKESTADSGPWTVLFFVALALVAWWQTAWPLVIWLIAGAVRFVTWVLEQP